MKTWTHLQNSAFPFEDPDWYANQQKMQNRFLWGFDLRHIA